MTHIQFIEKLELCGIWQQDVSRKSMKAWLNPSCQIGLDKTCDFEAVCEQKNWTKILWPSYIVITIAQNVTPTYFSGSLKDKNGHLLPKITPTTDRCNGNPILCGWLVHVKQCITITSQN